MMPWGWWKLSCVWMSLYRRGPAVLQHTWSSWWSYAYSWPSSIFRGSSMSNQTVQPWGHLSHQCQSWNIWRRLSYRQPHSNPHFGLDTYVDDTFIIWSHGRDKIQHFHNHINQQHLDIHFTVEEEKDGKLDSLDVQVTSSPEGLSTSVYCKPTHTDRYSPFHSHHYQSTTTEVHVWQSPPNLQRHNQGTCHEMPERGFSSQQLSRGLVKEDPCTPSHSSPSTCMQARII